QNSLDECATQLQRLLLFLQKYQDPGAGKVKNVVKRMMWPLKEQETKEWIGRIEGYKSTFSLALSTDGLYVFNPPLLLSAGGGRCCRTDLGMALDIFPGSYR